MRFRFLALPVAAVLLAAGCTPGNGTPTPTPTPSVSSVTSPSPTPTPTPTPSSEDALYAEAERVMTRVYEVSATFEVHGDYSAFPAELYELMADPYLGWTIALFEEGKEGGWHAPEGAFPVIQMAPLPGISSREGSEIALQLCVDTRNVPLLDGNGNVLSEGRIAHDTVFLKRFDGVLKVFTGTTEVVEACPF